MATGATIHTASGLRTKITRRAAPAEQPQKTEPATVTA